MKFRIEKGMHIVVEGSISVYTPRGEYQFQTVKIEPYGQGALALAYEQLKEKLKLKGYFDAQRKRELPKYVSKIALVTAKESAALHDMLKIIEQRWPLIEVCIIDTLVQGEIAAGQIARSLRYADTIDADVVIVGRGGGSTEDLWAFNEEAVADAIYSMTTPVVSAVGHEVDVMISDFVADKRAPTPSAALEMVLPDRNEILYTLLELTQRYSYVMEQKLQKLQRELLHTQEILLRSSPKRHLQEVQMKFTHLEDEFKRVIAYKIEHFAQMLPAVETSLHQNITFLIDKKMNLLESLHQNLRIKNPKLQCRKGWAQVSREGKTMTLESLEREQKFMLEDETTRVEAVCLAKLRI
jgi:exodeoxyribonuclease VII large subunit